MKNILLKTGFLLILLIVFILSCDKDFLNVSPKGIINSESFYATASDAEQAVTAVYGMLNYMQVWDMWILADLGSVASDDAEAGGATPTDVADWQNIDAFTFNAAQPGGIPQPYGIMYKMIFYANLAIENLPGIPEKDPEANPAVISQRVAEAKFLRALGFFYLVQIYGEVPLADHVLGGEEYDMTRSSLRSVFDLMEQDLTDAAAVLPASWPASDIGRATKGAAYGLLAKVLVFESSYAHWHPDDRYSLVYPGESRFKDLTEKWSEALTAAENVINSGDYELVGIDGSKEYESWRGQTDGYRYVWTTSGDNSKESLFEIQCGYYGLGWLVARGSSMVFWTSARWVYDPTTEDPAETSMWGFNIPSVDLINEFLQEERLPGDPLYDSESPGDPRFNTTIHTDRVVGGNDSIQLGDGVNGAYWAQICYTYDGNWGNKTRSFQAKYECSYDEFLAYGPTWQEAPFNNRLLRYADVVLLAAEAAIMSGNNDKALTYINMVRTRARMCGVEGNTCPADIEGTVTIEMLQHERRLELAMEGHRFFDLVRWNIAEEKLDGSYLDNQEVYVSFSSPKNDFFPIPQDELNINPELLQYEGW